MDNSLTILIPSYNEEKNLQLFLPQVLQYAKENNFNVILIDDGSTDNSKGFYSKINEDNFQVISYALNEGVGAALKKGILQVKTDYCITFDADGQHKLEDIKRFLEAISSNNYDLVIGERENVYKSGVYRSIGKVFIKAFAGIMVKKKIKDLNTGFRMFKTSSLRKYIECLPDGFSFHDISSLIFIIKKLNVGTVPVYVEDRKYGESTISTKHAFITIYDIINIVILFHPIRIFFPVSIFFFLVGILWSIPYLLAGKGLSIGALLLVLMGLFSFFFGIVSEQLSQIRRYQLKIND
jgi:glycosyltransferase involved in cell wall biosynthesis